jgi:hypothetical protein
MITKKELNIQEVFSCINNLKGKYFKIYENFILETETRIRYKAGEIICNDLAENAVENKRYDVLVKAYDVKYGGFVKDNLPADFIYSDSGLGVQFVS